MPRRLAWILAACATAGWGTSSVLAQVCTSDDDCAEGEHCDLPHVVRTDCDGGPCAEPDPVEGMCEALDPDDIECMNDDDCPEGFECEKGASAPGCDPSGGPCGDAGVRIEDTGTCHAVPILCEADADCPEGLVCEEGGGTGACTSSRDGGTHCEPLKPAEKECEYQPVECKSDDDCEPDFACTVFGTIEECSGGGSVCPDGEECPAPEPDRCTSRDIKVCFPERVDCTNDGDCAGDWRCVEVPENARGDDAPSGWEDATEVCLPEGLALVYEGRVKGGGLSHGDASGGGGEPTRSEEKASGGDDGCGSCHVGSAQGRARSMGAFLALAAAIALALRRRARS